MVASGSLASLLWADKRFAFLFGKFEEGLMLCPGNKRNAYACFCS